MFDIFIWKFRSNICFDVWKYCPLINLRKFMLIIYYSCCFYTLLSLVSFYLVLLCSFFTVFEFWCKFKVFVPMIKLSCWLCNCFVFNHASKSWKRTHYIKHKSSEKKSKTCINLSKLNVELFRTKSKSKSLTFTQGNLGTYKY